MRTDNRLVSLLALTAVFLGGCNQAQDANSQRVDAVAGRTPEVSNPVDLSRADSVVIVYKSPTCGCCTAWVDYMREQGFRVEAHDVADLRTVKRQHGVPSDLESCHTALHGGYVIEGHVPADDIRRLLRERPAITGIAVPGMPLGSPGMDVPGQPAERYNVIAFDRSGARTTFATH